MQRVLKLVVLAVVLGAGLLGSLGIAPAGAAAQGTGQLVVFSGRREPLLTPVLQLFQQQTGIRPTVKFGSTTALAQEILQLQDAGRPVPDVFIANDARTLEFLRLKGNVFQTYTSPQIAKIPERSGPLMAPG